MQINNQHFNNDLYTPGEIAPSLRFKTLTSLALWFIEKLSAVRCLFACDSDLKALTFSQSIT